MSDVGERDGDDMIQKCRDCMREARRDVVSNFAEVKRILTASSVLLGCVSRGHRFQHGWTVEERAAYWSQRLHMAQQYLDELQQAISEANKKIGAFS